MRQRAGFASRPLQSGSYPGALEKNTVGGRFESISWDETEKLLIQKLNEISAKGKGSHIVFLTGLITGTLKQLVTLWLKTQGSKSHSIYEPFAYKTLRKANHAVSGSDGIPTYRIDRADFLICFGADFLETWLSPVEYAARFAAFHEPTGGSKNLFVYVGPRLSATAASADH